MNHGSSQTLTDLSLALGQAGGRRGEGWERVGGREVIPGKGSFAMKDTEVAVNRRDKTCGRQSAGKLMRVLQRNRTIAGLFIHIQKWGILKCTCNLHIMVYVTYVKSII